MPHLNARHGRIALGLVFFLIARTIPVFYFSDSWLARLLSLILFASLALTGWELAMQFYRENKQIDDHLGSSRSNLNLPKIALEIAGILIVVAISLQFFMPITTPNLSLFFYGVVVAPIIEELTYRVFIFKALAQFGLYRALTLTVIVFAFVHLPNGYLDVGLAILAGYLLSFIYVLSAGNVAYCIAIHTAVNTAVLLFSFIPR